MRRVFYGLDFLIKSFLIRISPRLQRAISNHYWSKTGVATHASNSYEQFDAYYSGIVKLVPFDPSMKILDYGGGYGEIASKFKVDGHFVEIAEFSEHFSQSAFDKGINYQRATKLPPSYYDVIVANNCFHYNHPKFQRQEIVRLLNSLKPGGYLLLTDLPTIAKMNYLYPMGVLKFVARVTHVYQPTLGGFFIDGSRLATTFNGNLADSWAPYRQHLIIRKPVLPNGVSQTHSN